MPSPVCQYNVELETQRSPCGTVHDLNCVNSGTKQAIEMRKKDWSNQADGRTFYLQPDMLEISCSDIAAYFLTKSLEFF